MAEVIDDGDAARDAAHFHAALDALESAEGALNLAVLQPAVFRGGDDGERVAHVEFAHHVDVEFAEGISNSLAVGPNLRLKART